MNLRISRRKFLNLTGATAGGCLILPELFAGNNQKPDLRFGMISDIHYADVDPKGTRYFGDSLPKLNAAIGTMNSQKPDFVIELGDFKDLSRPPQVETTLKYLDEVERAFQKFDGPKYHVLGNHDMDCLSKKQFLERVESTDIPALQSYYSFNRGGYHFVVLDGNFKIGGKEYDHGNFDWKDAFVPETELDWLREDLKQNRLPVIVFIHQLLDESQGRDHCVKNAAEVRTILEHSGNVRCVFQGHVHKEKHSILNQIHYHSMLAMVDGSGLENNSFVVVDLYKNGRIVVNGFGKSGSFDFLPL